MRLWRCRGRDGVRRGWPGRHDFERRKYEICQRSYDILVNAGNWLSAGRHHLRPEHLNRCHRHRRAQQLRRRFHRGDRNEIKSKPAACGDDRRAVYRTCPSPSVATTRCARGDSLRCSSITRCAGMDMGIVNAGQLAIYDDHSRPSFATAVEDVILNRREDATERLVEIAPKYLKERPVAQKGQTRRKTSPGAKLAGGEATGARAGQGHRPSSSIEDTEEALARVR